VYSKGILPILLFSRALLAAMISVVFNFSSEGSILTISLAMTIVWQPCVGVRNVPVAVSSYTNVLCSTIASVL